MNPEIQKLKRRIHLLVWFFMFGLVAAGLTTFFIKAEVDWLMGLFGEGGSLAAVFPPLTEWVRTLSVGVYETAEKHPYIFYGFDWLGFAHIVIAVAFTGVLREPVRNVWVVEFGMIACALVVPAVLLFALARGIPWHWQIVDCSFGVVGIVPLWLVRRDILRLEKLQKS